MPGCSTPLLGNILSLPEGEATCLLVQALNARPNLALPVVSAVCPRLTYAPAKALTDKRMVGRIKSFNSTKGYGFISCPELYSTFLSDVFLHKAQIGNFSVHQEVSFAVLMNRYNKPQAYDLANVDGTAHDTGLPLTSNAGSPALASAAAAAAAAVAPPPRHAEAATAAPPPEALPPLGARLEQLAIAPLVGSSPTTDREGHGPEGDSPGAYILMQRALVAPTSAPCCEEDAVADLRPGTRVTVLEVVVNAEQKRVRAKLKEPAGWISLLNTENGYRWASKQTFQQHLPRESHEPLDPGMVAGLTSRRYHGHIKSFSHRGGFGFIDCPELKKRFGRDVYLHHLQFDGYSVGAEVSFGISVNDRGQPQAKELEACESAASSGAHIADDQVESAAPAGDPLESQTDELFEGVTCVICREVLHRATSITPCLHTFCSSCLGRWLWSSSSGKPQCPVCREAVKDVARNSTLDGIVESLLQIHPERARPPEELKGCDAHDLLQDFRYNVQRMMRCRSLQGARAAALEEAPTRSPHTLAWPGTLLRDAIAASLGASSGQEEGRTSRRTAPQWPALLPAVRVGEAVFASFGGLMAAGGGDEERREAEGEEGGAERLTGAFPEENHSDMIAESDMNDRLEELLDDTAYTGGWETPGDSDSDEYPWRDIHADTPEEFFIPYPVRPSAYEEGPATRNVFF